jgi:phosphohistidine phosphatase
MKTLTLLRHAKSGWDDPQLRDFDRPLNAKGKRAAHVVGQALRSDDLAFDHVLASPATRVVETLDEVAAGYGRTLAPTWDRRLYLASAAALLELIREAPDSVAHLLLVGHNPGLEELVLLLVPDQADDALRNAVELKFPTASAATMTLPIERWGDTRQHEATLTRFVRPRDIDAALGPDLD